MVCQQWREREREVTKRERERERERERYLCYTSKICDSLTTSSDFERVSAVVTETWKGYQDSLRV